VQEIVRKLQFSLGVLAAVVAAALNASSGPWGP
jgi:hypothetical protein